MTQRPRRRGYFRKPRTTELGKFLTAFRIEHHLTLRQVADNMGTFKSVICRIEMGERSRRALSSQVIYQLSRAYGAPIEDVQRKAHWPQLTLPLDVSDEEMQELMRHLKQFRRRKKQRNPSSSS